MVLLRLLPFAGWPLAAIVFWLWLGVRDDLAAEVERCNTDKLTSVLAAERISSQAQREAAKERIIQLTQQVALEKKAAQIANDAAIAAESRPVEVREVIKRVSDANLCLKTDIPADLVDALRL